jgi:hypothetical protein
LTLLAIAGALCSDAAAQDVHHWTQQYGTKPALLGGAGAAGSRDAAAVYYNPGALALIPEDSVSASGNAYGVQRIAVAGAAGLRDDQTARDTMVVPGLIGGVITGGQGEHAGHALGFVILTRSAFDTRLSGRETRTEDILLGAPGTETFVAEADFRSSLSELWAGVGYSAQLHEFLSVGITSFFTWRSQTSERSFTGTAYPSTLGPAGAYGRQETIVELENAAVLWKIGAATEVGIFSFTLNITTPSVGLGGDGRVVNESIAVNTDVDSDGIADPLSLAVRDSNADSHWHRSGSVALGASVTLEQFKLHLLTEWFAPTPRYAAVRTDEPSGGATRTSGRTAAEHSEQGIVNFAFATEWKLGGSFAVLAGFRTDLSPVDTTSDSDVSLGVYDLYHLTLGVSWIDEKSEFTVGLGYSWGDGELTAPADFSTASESNRLQGTSSTSDLEYTAVVLMLGYTYRFPCGSPPSPPTAGSKSASRPLRGGSTARPSWARSSARRSRRCRTCCTADSSRTRPSPRSRTPSSRRPSRSGRSTARRFCSRRSTAAPRSSASAATTRRTPPSGRSRGPTPRCSGSAPARRCWRPAARSSSRSGTRVPWIMKPSSVW